MDIHSAANLLISNIGVLRVAVSSSHETTNQFNLVITYFLSLHFALSF